MNDNRKPDSMAEDRVSKDELNNLTRYLYLKAIAFYQRPEPKGDAVDFATEAKVAISAYTTNKIIEELEDVKPGKDTDVIHLSKIIDERIAELKALNHRSK